MTFLGPAAGRIPSLLQPLNIFDSVVPSIGPDAMSQAHQLTDRFAIVSVLFRIGMLIGLAGLHVIASVLIPHFWGHEARVVATPAAPAKPRAPVKQMTAAQAEYSYGPKYR